MSQQEGVQVRALYGVREAMALLSLSRTQIYELIRSDRLITVRQGRRRLVPAQSFCKLASLGDGSDIAFTFLGCGEKGAGYARRAGVWLPATDGIGIIR